MSRLYHMNAVERIRASLLLAGIIDGIQLILLACLFAL